MCIIATSKMDKEETIKLIDVYRKKDILWDPKHPNHYNRRRKEDAWKEVANEMNKTVSQCQKKMEYLLSALRREKMKINKSIGTPEMYRSSWFAFNSLKFLLDKNKSKQTLDLSQTIPDCNTSKLETVLQIEEPNICPIPLEKCNSSPNMQCSQQRKPKARKLSSSAGQQRLDRTIDTIATTASEFNEECYHFGNLVASKLRIYDDRIRCAIQNDILTIFVRASRGYYDNFNTFPNHILDDAHTVHSRYPPDYAQSPVPSTSSHSSQLNSNEIQILSSTKNASICNDSNIQDLV